jgi:hypothetical protein
MLTIKNLSKELTERYGKGYDRSNLYHCLRFYKIFPGIVDTLCRKSGKLLSWSHYRALLQVEDEKARAWYEKEALEQTWGVRTLQRNISSQYYYRILQAQKQDIVEPVKKDKKIIIFGDSITQGYGAENPSNRYAEGVKKAVEL